MPPTTQLAGEVETGGLRASAARDDCEAWRCNLKDAKVLLGPRDEATWFTGKHPTECAGYCEADGTLRSLPDLATDATREQVMAQVDNMWALTEVLFSALQGEEAFYRPPYHHTRHPLIFYYAHTAVVYVNKMRVAGLLDSPVDLDFESLFETGVDEMSWDDLSKNEVEWPRVAEVTAYRRTVYNLVRAAVESHPCFDSPATPLTPSWAVYMGIAHEQIHLETSSVLFRELPVRLLTPPKYFPPTSEIRDMPHPPREGVDYPPPEELIEVPAPPSPVVLGRPAEANGFGWDNEFGTREVPVSAFRASRCKITNGAFWEFVSGHGYRDDRWWSEEGRAWRVFRNVKWPTFWVPDGPAGLHQYKLRTLFSVVGMQWDWPAVVNVHEARAYCAWFRETKLGGGGGGGGDKPSPDVAVRLPCEAEAHVLAGAGWFGNPAEEPSLQQDSAAFRETGRVRANLNLAHGSECPVESVPANEFGFRDPLGNVWDWTEDHFNPLEGFKVNYLYDDFSTPCFDGKHHIIMGGSFISTGNLASAFSRYHFRPHFFQHAGFRVVVTGARDPDCAYRFRLRDNAEVAAGAQAVLAAEWLPISETGPADTVSLMQAIEPIPFASRISSLAAEHLPSDRRRHALDLGCGTGRIAAALADANLAGFASVTGLDIDSALVDCGRAVLSTGRAKVTRLASGVSRDVEVQLPATVNRDAVTLRHMDGCCIAPDTPPCDLVVLSDVLTHCASPRAVLGRLGGVRGLVPIGGIVIVAETWAWEESRTPRGTWLGSTRDEDGASTAKASMDDAVAEALGGTFSKVWQGTIARVSALPRNSEYAVNVPVVTVWKRDA